MRPALTALSAALLGPALALPLAALPPAGEDGADPIPRTASGRPDLSGTYDIASLTPFERDPKYGEQLELTAEEAEAIERQAAMAMAFADAPSDPDRKAPPKGGDGSAGAAGKVGGYNAFWVDSGTETLAVGGSFRTSILVDPANGRLPPLTEAGKARRAKLRPYVHENTGDAWWLKHEEGPYDDPESLAVIERCLYVAPATAPMLPVLYNNVKRIVQTDHHLLILVEWMHEARRVRLGTKHDPPAHLPEHLRSLAGDSIGWWEDDTLVVETTNFLERPGVARQGLRIVERFSRMGPQTLLYEFTVHDPDYTAPYSGELPFPQTDGKLYEYACHEGNYAMGNILRGARLLEREAMEGAE
ncbi:MAG: hypothetical protein DWQ30_17320 [Acidobacteria bacterium]|nr:MAG: hypothetical protein DWQ30_17320 [Acidobacteriota bacterium]